MADPNVIIVDNHLISEYLRLFLSAYYISICNKGQLKLSEVNCEKYRCVCALYPLLFAAR